MNLHKDALWAITRYLKEEKGLTFAQVLKLKTQLANHKVKAEDIIGITVNDIMICMLELVEDGNDASTICCIIDKDTKKTIYQGSPVVIEQE